MALKVVNSKYVIAGIYRAGGHEASGNPDLEALVENQGGRIFTSSVGGGDCEVIDYLVNGHNEGKKIKIYGHSRGVVAAVRISNKLGDMNITIAEVNLYDPVAMYGGGSLVLKRPNVMRVNNYNQRNPIDSNGEAVNGITSMGDGRVLISPHRMRTSLGFAKTYYHEGIHSLHAATGIFKAWKLRYGSDEASRITEFFAHSMTDGMSGGSMKFSAAFSSRYYPALYIQSLSSFLRP